MNLITAHYVIMECPTNAAKSIERAARTCYKSEDKITDNSAEKMTKGLIERGHHAMIEFGGWIVVKFYSNRGFSHELVRHRIASLAQESSRFCDYSRDKFRNELTCIDPEWMLEQKVKDPEKQAEFKAHLIETWVYCEERYMDLVGRGCPAEIAREGIPVGIKAEIIIGATVREWRHIFSLRCSKKAHPRMRELMVPLRSELRERLPVVFDDV